MPEKKQTAPIAPEAPNDPRTAALILEVQRIVRDAEKLGATQCMFIAREALDDYRATGLDRWTPRKARLATVAGYFQEKLGVAPPPVGLDECPMDSTVGMSARKAIDAAAILIECVQEARGPGSAMERAVISAAADSIVIFWTG